MTLRAICKRELERIPRNLVGGPDNSSDQRAYVDAFERNCVNETHAKRVVDSLIETCTFYPKIADIVTMCKSIDTRAGETLPAGCATCKGELWIVVTRGTYEGTSRCSCERGRFLAARPPK